MRLSLMGALAMALLANLLPGCNRIASDQEESAAGQASERSTDPATPAAS